MDYITSGFKLHDLIVAELINKRSIAALVFLIDAGRELEFSFGGTDFFISKDTKGHGIELAQGNHAEHFEDMHKLICCSTLVSVPFIDAWPNVSLNCLL